MEEGRTDEGVGRVDEGVRVDETGREEEGIPEVGCRVEEIGRVEGGLIEDVCVVEVEDWSDLEDGGLIEDGWVAEVEEEDCSDLVDGGLIEDDWADNCDLVEEGFGMEEEDVVDLGVEAGALAVGFRGGYILSFIEDSPICP